MTGRMRKRCAWARSELSIAYHDQEWGVPAYDDHVLFEFLLLEGAQAGLSWETILKKRAAYRKAYASFDPERVARFGERQKKRLLADEGIVRNRLKVEASISNARAFLEIRDASGSFANYLWGRFDGRPTTHRWKHVREVPAVTPQAEALSRDLRRRGFRFVGPTICYAFMQAVGVVNDHTVDCFRHRQVGREAVEADGRGRRTHAP